MQTSAARNSAPQSRNEARNGRFCAFLRKRPASGLTLIELMAALAVLALMLTLIPPALDGISTRSRLRAAAHEVESTVRWAQNAAAVKGSAVQVLYDVAAGSYGVRAGDRDLTCHRLPAGVTFKSVRFGDFEVLSDVAALRVYPDGTLDSHQVTIASAEDLQVRLTFCRLTGEPVYEEFTYASP